MRITGASKGKQFTDRVLAGEVRGLALHQLQTWLKKKCKKPSDVLYQRQLLLKISPSLLPRLNEVTGEGGGPVKVDISGTLNKFYGSES